MKRQPEYNTTISTSDQIIMHALALGKALGLSDADMAASALKAAIVFAEKQPDPDLWAVEALKLREG